ncbi:chromosomal replication initiator protein DnaA [Sulfurimicrobium lacus]|uniref:Chromosomal replication initiator protein DnaA n=1 Tax=Sulfurimicrobium lacus TaxID=2715678 RepID=A0A6F8V8L1_9PROT|nr:chromosomal replication initiator protein DnaA [Sulfurimicrobium lacus]BCB25115.1 chromosomal replication initiator protein DnaA [Sulfurimicrobium lacus]
METFWQACLSRFEQELTPQQFNNWIKPLRFVSGPDFMRIEAPNRFIVQWVKDKFLSRFEEMGEAHFSRPIQLSLVVAENKEIKENKPLPVKSVPTPVARSGRSEKSGLNPSFTFANFVTGKANQLARAAALQVAENPGTAYNPLFVYGGVGLGKTHLIQAIGNYVQEQNSNAKISYLHAERYVSDVVRAYQHKAFDDFKRYYHSLDLLLIDDIQFFSGKARTQEEFFYAFNALIESKKQVIITCDTYPKQISGMEDRLISRFGWGLTVAIEPPELEMRVAILLKKAEMEGFHLDDDVAFFIAKQIRSNVRELEGALKKVIAYSRFTGHAIGLDLAKEALKDLLAVQNRQISIENIQKTVADYYKIKVAEMYSKKRSRNVARPRQVAMALAKELTHLSFPEIGDAFGGRDHTTVMYACRKIEELKISESGITRDISVLLQVLRS